MTKSFITITHTHKQTKKKTSYTPQSHTHALAQQKLALEQQRIQMDVQKEQMRLAAQQHRGRGEVDEEADQEHQSDTRHVYIDCSVCHTVIV